MNKNQEQNRERFKRLATQRTNMVLQKLKVLGNCANRSAYDYTEEDINKIFSEIERRVRETKSKFHFLKNREFKL
jgi:CHASE1-domain containing sensor protein